ncbi:MAG TPA: O-antigen ligase family protein [Anaerolineales bacterium]|nr:O-antigen ligase family protein [Anaerolineales bacterium]
MRKLYLDSLVRILWGAVLVTLPVTSFRYMPFMGSGTVVRPLALYPLGLLMPILLYQIWTKRITHPWNRTLTILLAFTLTALLSTAIGALYAPIELRGQGYGDRALRAWITLVIGLSFFVSAMWMNRNEDDLKFSLKWLFTGLVLHIVWGGIQAVGLNIGLRGELNEIQTLFSTRGLVRNKRISGLAYEPSWLAGQLASLYIPWLFAALVARYRMSRFRWLEPSLFLGGLAILLLTYSRSGLAILLGAAIVTFIAAGSDTMKKVWRWYREGFRRGEDKSRRETMQASGSRIVVSLILIGAVAGTGLFLADKGYIAAFWNSSAESLFEYAVDVYLGPRLAYVTAALSAFQAHPMTGVGLGASGFYMYQNMPDWSLINIPEISRQLSPLSNLYPNPKNLYVRLLAETGLPGFTLYVSFLFANLAYAWMNLRRKTQLHRFLGAAGLFSVIAVAMQGISQDSFAVPEVWINLGVLAGMTSLAIISGNSSRAEDGALSNQET